MTAVPQLGSAPDWFHRAIATPRYTHFIDADGARLHYTCWDAPGAGLEKPPLLLLHGFRAHSRIWDCIAPYLTDRYRVVAPDFTGMGESDWREEYSIEGFTRDIYAVIEHAQLAPVVGIGHSFGGGRLLRACADRPELFSRAIVLDSGILFADDPEPQTKRVGNPNPLPDYASLRSRYRLLPEQPSESYLLEYTAFHSIRQSDAGWTWKFDTSLPTAYPERDGEALLRRIPLPVDVVHGQHSAVLGAERAGRMVAALPHGRGPIAVAEGHHHFMLENPLALVTLLRALLA